jgi:hypothetical protein
MSVATHIPADAHDTAVSATSPSILRVDQPGSLLAGLLETRACPSPLTATQNDTLAHDTPDRPAAAEAISR